MKSTVLNLPVLTLMELWAELTECYHGVHGYGGNTAEIYAYRFCQYSPTAHGYVTSKERQDTALKELAIQANEMLIELCAMFAEYHVCYVFIENRPFATWRLNYEFDHRLEVMVESKGYLPTNSPSRPSNKAMQANY